MKKRSGLTLRGIARHVLAAAGLMLLLSGVCLAFGILDHVFEGSH